MSFEKNIILIQSLCRRFLVKRRLSRLRDGMTKELLLSCIKNYINTIQNEKMINQLLTTKKIRYSNFPSHISENLVKYAFYKKYRIMPSWDTNTGDLIIYNNYCRPIRIEVKGSLNLSKGPSSFGPTEEWDMIYFVDAYNYESNIYKIYEINLSNRSDKWKNLRINKTQTYYEQCCQKRRPRLNFYEIKRQLSENCRIIFHGSLDDLL